MTFTRERFTQVLHRTWADPDFLALGQSGRMIFLWSFTNPHAAACGLYVVTVPQLTAALGPDTMRNLWLDHLDTALAQLARKPMLLYDEDASVLWVVNRARHANTSPRAQRLMRAEYDRVPPSRLRHKFHQLYAPMLQLAPESGSVRPRG